MDLHKVGKLIAKKRKEKGFTQESLGSELGVSDKTVSKWERGINAPDISLLVELSKRLGVSVNNLLLGIDEENTKEEIINEDKNFISNMNYYFKNYKKNIKKKMYLIIIFIIFVFSLLFVINNFDKCQLYSIVKDSNDNIEISGYIYFNQKASIVNINQLKLINYSENEIEVKMVTVDLLSNDEIIGRIKMNQENNKQIYLNNEIKNIRINALLTKKTNETIFNKNEVSNLKIKITYIELNDEENVIEQQIKIKKEFTNNRIFY